MRSSVQPTFPTEESPLLGHAVENTAVVTIPPRRKFPLTYIFIWHIGAFLPKNELLALRLTDHICYEALDDEFSIRLFAHLLVTHCQQNETLFYNVKRGIHFRFPLHIMLADYAEHVIKLPSFRDLIGTQGNIESVVINTGDEQSAKEKLLETENRIISSLHDRESGLLKAIKHGITNTDDSDVLRKKAWLGNICYLNHALFGSFFLGTMIASLVRTINQYLGMTIEPFLGCGAPAIPVVCNAFCQTFLPQNNPNEPTCLYPPGASSDATPIGQYYCNAEPTQYEKFLSVYGAIFAPILFVTFCIAFLCCDKNKGVHHQVTKKEISHTELMRIRGFFVSSSNEKISGAVEITENDNGASQRPTSANASGN